METNKTKTRIICTLFFCLGISEIPAQDPAYFTGAVDSVKTQKMKTVKRTVVIHANANEIFAFMDDIDNTGMHMTKSNAPMMGGKLKLQWLTTHKTGLGTKYRWTGKVIGMKMDFTVEVTKWVEGKEKVWETVGDAKMIVLSWYRMYLILTPLDDGTTRTELGIYYTKPKGSVLGFFLARWYAVWCVKSMLKDTEKHFKEKQHEK